jgi:PAS domain S-box-containing protein
VLTKIVLAFSGYKIPIFRFNNASNHMRNIFQYVYISAISLLFLTEAASAMTVDELDVEGLGFLRAGQTRLAEKLWVEERSLSDREHNKKGSLRARIRLAGLELGSYEIKDLRKMVASANEQRDACLQVLALQNLAAQSPKSASKTITKQIKILLPSVGKECVGESPNFIDVLTHNPGEGIDASTRALVDFLGRFAPGGAGYNRTLYSSDTVSKILFALVILFVTVLVFVLIGVLLRLASVRGIEREKLRKSVIERLSEGVLGVSKDGKVLFANGTAARFSLRQPLEGSNVKELIALEHGTVLNISEKEIPNLGTFTGIVLRKNESPLPCEVTISKNNAWGSGLAYVVVFRDITERIEAERSQAAFLRELKTSNELLDAYARMIAHDLRTPLSGVQAYCEALIEDFPNTNPDVVALIENIQKESQRSVEYIQGVLDYARSTDINLIPSEINIRTLLSEIWKSLNPPDDIRFDIGGLEVSVVCLPEYGVRQIFQNLLSNAIKYRDTRKSLSTVQISATATHPNVEFRVRDNGIGISDEYLEKIFEIGFKVSNRKDSDGFGLGQVSSLVQRMRGSVRVESKLGDGSTFILLFADCLVRKL